MDTVKQQLQNGSLVEFRNGVQYMFIRNHVDAGFIDPTDRGHMCLNSYDDDLRLASKDMDSDWDVVKFTKPLGLVDLKMDWDVTLNRESKIRWERDDKEVNYNMPALVRQDWADADTGKSGLRIIETTGEHHGLMFTGEIIYDSNDVESDCRLSDNLSKGDKGVTVTLIKYLN